MLLDFLPTTAVITVFAVLTVAGQVIAAMLLAAMAVGAVRHSRHVVERLVSRHALLLMLVTSLAATLGSLYFSDIAGWTPCKDCWFQRIAMYPQTVILALALWKHDSHASRYVLALSLIGLALSLDHYADQVEAALTPAPPTDPLKPCGGDVPCAATQIHFMFGYITIPMMAATVFLLNILGSITVMRATGNRS